MQSKLNAIIIYIYIYIYIYILTFTPHNDLSYINPCLLITRKNNNNKNFKKKSTETINILGREER